MNERQATRLVNVADALRDADANKWAFNMGSYGWDRDLSPDSINDLGIPKDEVEYIEENRCGTPACAIGHYAVRGDLQQKFTLDKHGELVMAKDESYHLGHSDRTVRDWFGITDDESEVLFDTTGCGRAQTALQAAEYIERFVKGKGFNIIKG